MCHAELKKGRLVGPVGKICFMPRPLYALCDMIQCVYNLSTMDYSDRCDA